MYSIVWICCRNKKTKVIVQLKRRLPHTCTPAYIHTHGHIYTHIYTHTYTRARTHAHAPPPPPPPPTHTHTHTHTLLNFETWQILPLIRREHHDFQSEERSIINNYVANNQCMVILRRLSFTSLHCTAVYYHGEYFIICLRQSD